MRICFVNASGQNVFFDELLEALRAALQGHGLAVETAVDHFPPLADDLVYVFVPHEFLPLTLSDGHPSTEQLRRTVVIGTEQPGTGWFQESAAVAERAAATVDIHPLGVAEVKRRGVQARLLQLGYVPAWDYWHGSRDARPIDVTFLGGYTTRRGLALARCGRVLDGRRASIHLVDTRRPHTAGDAFFLSGERKFRHLAASKIVLSAHRERNAYLEWLRLLGAAANGCVVLTEHSSGFAPLVPGEHFVSVEFDNLPVALSLLLDDEERVAAIRDAAHEFLRTTMPLSQSITVLAEAVEIAREQPVRHSMAYVAPVKPAPRKLQKPAPAWLGALDGGTETDVIRMGLKQLVLGQRRIERRLMTIARPGEETIDIRRFGPPQDRAPRISVAISLHNYAHTISDALDSVAFSTLRELEAIVVDDASTDDSVAMVERALARLPWLTVTLLQRSHNAGLPAARNLALEHARGEYVFILDADNSLYPHGLERLSEALNDDPDAAFAYGIIEKFDVKGPRELLSWHPWAPDRFRDGNYIDAMALIRKDRLLEVGGYLVDDRVFGWEDFALWCAMTQAGFKGAHVPEIVGRYRTSPSSMIASTNIDASDAWALLVERYPFLSAEEDEEPVSLSKR